MCDVNIPLRRPIAIAVIHNFGKVEGTRACGVNQESDGLYNWLEGVEEFLSGARVHFESRLASDRGAWS
jgi:hypothetical protein